MPICQMSGSPYASNHMKSFQLKCFSNTFVIVCECKGYNQEKLKAMNLCTDCLSNDPGINVIASIVL